MVGDDFAEAERRIVDCALRMYRSDEERAAMRGALGDAAGLCDALSEMAKRQNTYSGGRVTQGGQVIADTFKQAGDAIWAMRDKITFDAGTDSATGSETTAAPERSTEPQS